MELHCKEGGGRSGWEAAYNIAADSISLGMHALPHASVLTINHMGRWGETKGMYNLVVLLLFSKVSFLLIGFLYLAGQHCQLKLEIGHSKTGRHEQCSLLGLR